MPQTQTSRKNVLTKSRTAAGEKRLTAKLLCLLVFILSPMSFSSNPALAQVALPHTESNVILNDLVDVEIVTLDAGTLPARANIEVSVIRPPTHPDLELELRMTCEVECQGGLNPFTPVISLSPGESIAVFPLAETCVPATPLPGVSCDLEAQALVFGSGGAPASIDLAILGYTDIPFRTEVVEYDPIPAQTSLAFEADRDTTLYQEQGDWNNGLGNSIWAGLHYHGFFPFGQTHVLRGMMSFDVSAPLFPVPGKIPLGSTIDDAVLTLALLDNEGPISEVTIQAVTDIDSDPFSVNDWNSGPVDAPGNEIESSPSTNVGATWDQRDWPSGFWNTPGAATGPALASAFTPSSGVGDVQFSSPSLTNAIRNMWSTRQDGMGFQFRGTTSPLGTGDQAARFASRDHPTASLRPELVVYYTPEFAAPYTNPNMLTGTVTFIGEGENFRWVYDDDQDDILFTDIGGRCEETEIFEDTGLFEIPYNYSFLGDPNYVGLDCCTWQIESEATGTLGTGQALFFLNLDASDPANFPPDTDSDGIVDLCDNCPYTPNGPLMGSCVGGPSDAQLCRSDQECAAPSFCSLSQQDDDFELPGQACPEPGMGVTLMVGTLSLARRRRREASPRRAPR